MTKHPEPEKTAPEAAVPDAETDKSRDGQGDMAERLEALRTESEQHRERSLRLAAELENVRRRSARELDSARRYALERFAGELLPVADSLELALASAEDAPESVREGLEMTLRQLRDVFARHHIEGVSPLAGDAFDPEVHEAMATQPSSEAKPDHVLHVVQKGYRLHERLLRPARVIVARPPESGA